MMMTAEVVVPNRGILSRMRRKPPKRVAVAAAVEASGNLSEATDRLARTLEGFLRTSEEKLKMEQVLAHERGHAEGDPDREREGAVIACGVSRRHLVPGVLQIAMIEGAYKPCGLRSSEAICQLASAVSEEEKSAWDRQTFLRARTSGVIQRDRIETGNRDPSQLDIYVPLSKAFELISLFPVGGKVKELVNGKVPFNLIFNFQARQEEIVSIGPSVAATQALTLTGSEKFAGAVERAIRRVVTESLSPTGETSEDDKPALLSFDFKVRRRGRISLIGAQVFK